MKKILEEILILFQTSFLGKEGPVWNLILPKTVWTVHVPFFPFSLELIWELIENSSREVQTAENRTGHLTDVKTSFFQFDFQALLASSDIFMDKQYLWTDWSPVPRLGRWTGFPFWPIKCFASCCSPLAGWRTEELSFKSNIKIESIWTRAFFARVIKNEACSSGQRGEWVHLKTCFRARSLRTELKHTDSRGSCGANFSRSLWKKGNLRI